MGPALTRVGCLVLLFASSAWGQTFVRTCTADNDRGEALSATVDGVGDVHLFRVAKVGGDLVHTRIEPDGTVTDAVLAARISRLATDEVDDTGAIWDGDQLHVCFRDAQRGGFHLASATPGQAWQRQQLAAGFNVGHSCDVAVVGGRLSICYTDGDTLRWAELGPGGWQTQAVAATPGTRQGVDCRIAAAGDHVIISHHDATAQRLRISHRVGAGWQTQVADAALPNPAGWSPAPLLDADGTLEIYHGGRPPRPGVDADQGLYSTSGPAGGPYESAQYPGAAIGGANAAVQTAQGRALFTRRLQRSAIFGAADGLEALLAPAGQGFAHQSLEVAGAADRRHRYRNLDATADPFGLPVLAYLDERAAHFDQPGAAPVCLYRLADRDADALPDAIESAFGTDPDVADTDGDGRTDGEEVLIDGTDPRVGDGCDPAPETCDGIDEDCDEAVDEGLSRPCYPAAAETAGVGRCRGGTERCVGGDFGRCVGAITPRAETCNGLDDDCDGTPDEGLGGAACETGAEGQCGVGVQRCEGGALRCRPVNDAQAETCNGDDDDCDGALDEGRLRCGVGACAREVDACVFGRDNRCEPGPAAQFDALCDGEDTDCDARVDEDYAGAPTHCGEGRCRAAGRRVCEAGAERDTCQPLPPAADDATCDGVDDDCDGRTDEAADAQPVRCGVGACARDGQQICRDGLPEVVCAPGAPAPADATCDGVDDDCDGRTDEDAPDRPVRCGQGACEAEGRARCVAGRLEIDCTPGPPARRDARCDGIDADCDGRTDEDARPEVAHCGQGVCRASGERRCVDGALHIVCAPGEPVDADAACDGLDTDCDGQADEAYRGPLTACGVGACAARAPRRCVDGVAVDACQPRPPLGPDDTCDGVDDDCDGRADEAYVGPPTRCGAGSCRADGQLVCRDGQTVDTCDAAQPGAALDDTCDGVDDDCDGLADEDAAPTEIRCGVGVCAAQGQRRCEAGRWVEACVPAPAGGPDRDCDGVDEDCDGRVDEGFVAVPTRCGEGACAAIGERRCVGGRVVDTCQPEPPAADDARCDGVDADCDGRVDEAAPVEPITCGEGACAAAGERRCQGARWIDVCRPGQPAPDDQCDGVDTDCDGRTDEGAAPTPTHCGEGACRAQGERACVDGAWATHCEPGAPAPIDATCDGLDDDCDGRADEDHAPRPATCGRGQCQRDGLVRCVGGIAQLDCVPGRPDPTDATCDSLDDDCDGRPDEDAADQATRCGEGLCQAVGRRRCVAGAWVEACAPGPAAPLDATCDGLDDDCDGRADEDALAEPVQCGAGACVADGARRCVDGAWIDTCVPRPPAALDATCDGADDDCDGRTDEDAGPEPVRCGVGICAREGESRCEGGVRRVDCTPGAPALDDARCDGRDDDCDGRADEDARPLEVACGVGACRQVGLARCVAGARQSDCAPGVPAAADGTCDGLDDDCDGRVDEDAAVRPTRCGVGACARAGVERCVGGAWSVECAPAAPAPTDATCDGVDDDCDGRADESVPFAPIACGAGVCRRPGVRRCRDGQLEAACVPGPAEAADDAACDGRDTDCDGRVDEDAPDAPIECGRGACRRAGAARCVDGRRVADCQPGQPAANDASCDGVDDDCDGQMDEDAPQRPVRCGVGACARAGIERCEGGARVTECAPGQPAPTDETCDGVDDDCDGRADEDAQPTDTTCGRGACARAGRRTCVAGAWRDDCRPAVAQATDDDCDGVDDDCDGQTDEAWRGRRTRCGVGACAEAGAERCQAGVITDDCTPGAPAPADDQCDGLDDDCDGRADEDAADRPIRCGRGVCAADGVSRCHDGRWIAQCVPGAPQSADADCDGRDDDCDGRADEAHEPEPVRCGLGACQAVGARRCAAGQLALDCAPGAPLGPDDTCDAIDDDCDGRVDEDADGGVETCGEGACAAVGPRRCVGGRWQVACQPAPPAADDPSCDGVDDDCDGRTDEDWSPLPTRCGVGVCAAEGEVRCLFGQAVDACTPGEPLGPDDTCDGRDDDCDGRADEACAAGPDAGPLPDLGGFDAGTPFDADVPDPGWWDAGLTGEFGRPAPDAQVRSDDETESARQRDDGCGCAAHGHDPIPGVLLLGLLAGFRRRRPRR